MSTSKHVIAWRRRTKKRALIYKGSFCRVCALSTENQNLHFHHLDPEKKDFGVGSGNTRSWSSIMDELDKCILLCGPCHRKVHAGTITLVGIDFGPSPAEGRKLLSESDVAPRKPRTPNKCNDCGYTPISTHSLRCKSCANTKRKPKIIWPPIGELLQKLAMSNYSALGRELGVSDNAIRKHIKKYHQWDSNPHTLKDTGF